MRNMGYPTASTTWPSTDCLSAPVKQLIDNFPSLVDQKGEDIGDQLAHNIFTENGTFLTVNGAFKGATGMMERRFTVQE